MYQMAGLLAGGSQGGLMNSGLFSRGLMHGVGDKNGDGSAYSNAIQKQGLANANMLGMSALRQYQDMSQYAQPHSILSMINNMGGGQHPYQNIVQPYQNPYVNGLLGDY